MKKERPSILGLTETLMIISPKSTVLILESNRIGKAVREQIKKSFTQRGAVNISVSSHESNDQLLVWAVHWDNDGAVAPPVLNSLKRLN